LPGDQVEASGRLFYAAPVKMVGRVVRGSEAGSVRFEAVSFKCFRVPLPAPKILEVFPGALLDLPFPMTLPPLKTTPGVLSGKE
jgi:hypothetical protein